MNAIPFLHLDCINTDPQLSRLLPSDVARNYHALPVATDGRCITVAMAHPEDSNASAVVCSAVGAPTCLVRADPGEIDRRLSEIWPLDPPPRLRLLVCTPISEGESTLHPYTQAIAALLQADLVTLNFSLHWDESFNTFLKEAEQFQPDLVILEIPNCTFKKRMLIDLTVDKLMERLPVSILVIKSERWPLQKILYVIRDGHETCDAAVDWVIRLARCSHATVSLLPLLHPVPEMYGTIIRHSIPSLLASNDPLGSKLRTISLRLLNEGIQGSIKLRGGPFLEQLRHEISDSETDLVVIEAEPKNPMWRWLIGEVVNNLFVWFDRPLLISRK